MIGNPLIAQNELFADLDEAALSEALSILQAAASVYKKGEFLQQTGKRMPRFALVLSGAVQVCTDDIEGNRMIMADVSEGGTFGESLSFLKVSESPVYIVAAQQAEVLWLSTDALFKGDANPLVRKLEARFTAMLAKRTLSMNNRIQVLSKLRLRDKLITYFTEMAGTTGQNTFTISMNRDDMAAYMGTNRSALSRELSQMKADGLIDFYRSTFKILKN